MVIQDNQIISNRYLQSIGIDGTGEIITVIDSGLDIGHCFFRDPNNSYETILGNTNLNHRKVVRYESFADFTDNVDGHGTHVSGTIAGESVEPNRLIAAYNGIAPKSKIYFVDIGVTSQSASKLSGQVNYNIVFNQMLALNSLIQSNSWGYDVKSPEVTMVFDQFALATSMLIVFSNGNEKTRNSVFSPADGKNILSVAFSTKPYTSDIELGKYIAKIIFDDNVKRDVIKSYKLGTADPPIVNTEMQFCDTDAKDCTYETGKVMVSPVSPSISLSYPFVQISQTDYEVAKTKTSCSILLLPSTTPRGFQRHEYSSRGTTLLGTLKPEIIAPGTNTISSKGSGGNPNNIGECSINALIKLNGSSMSTPAISGMAGLIENYFKDGWYPKMSKNPEEGFNVSSYVVCSILINSAKSMNNDPVPNYEQGFGMPDLKEVLGFGDVGVRFFGFKMKPKSRMKFQIKTTRVADFSATISYNDYPYGSDNGYILVIDIDMIVRDPNGKIYNGNNVPGEFTSTNEKVFIKDAPVGTYFIDLINPTNVTDNLTVIIGMAVSGGFDTTDNEVNPSNGVILENNECINSCGNGKCSDGLCECDENHIGVYCQREINKINLNQNNTITLTPRYAYYFKFDNEDTDNDPSMRITSSLPASVRVCLDN
ncbi:Clan SB, family S8, subtilisin-like serine peptidase [Trichomonas vaginalis G3]|uniref:Clan SB, family S8, subtilisin-like serine peptidase n=1 Tax=Trichomonas vaginalis (strain ATCC PRA-98 / G3) TaxID=412133 RepID=A2EQC7_TRIV3|nr:peptidases S8 Kp43 protease domain-containing protein [Trichomonas vaginalis G3]EAY05143.1 Clan SB, family S8, subtilisin-like serine peptidase [Trichomonas vaginalis G3]KAI5510956.1 peptidases S8 Kp43 protease domain-containing protein [Trichomonas vaginalis G3]|eukprot:XP_001317366.1 Clan SB, family S8, subtilisin-like serine peptidase [Trichomonas vaginalis G3]